MDNLLQSIESLPSSSQLPVAAPLPGGIGCSADDHLLRLRGIVPDSFEGITLDEFLAGTGEENGEVGTGVHNSKTVSTGEARQRKKRGAGEMNEIAAKESDCSTRREKRILKNRESAARSRERKQAYTLELEALVAKLEKENSMLLAEQMEFGQMRLKQLLENVIPITERKRLQSPLRRTRSMEF